MQDKDKTAGWRAARRRMFVLVPLIVIVSLFWVLMLSFTNLPLLALVAIAFLSLVVLSLATAWTAMALPGRGQRGNTQ